MAELRGRYGYNSETDSAKQVVDQAGGGGGTGGGVTPEQLATGLAAKADAAAVAAKADKTYVDTQLAQKAAASDLAAKANADDVTAALAGKASTAAVAAKASTADVTAALATKADTSALTTGLAGKAAAADVAAVREAVRTAPRIARGAVAFTWDDGWDTHPTIAQYHADRGQKATFYITTGLLNTSQHIPTSGVATIAALGHEIGSHNVTHVAMTGLNATTRQPEWDNSKSTLEGLVGAGKVTSYAYPTGANDLTTNQEAYGRYSRVADIGLSQGYNKAPYIITRDHTGFKHGRFPWNQTTHAQVMALLRDQVLRNPVTLTLYAHQMGNADTPTQAQILEALDFCQTFGIPCLTTAEALPGPLVVNPGFEDGLAGWTVLYAGAAASGTTVDTVTDTPSAGHSGTKSLRIISPNTTTSGDSVSVMQVVPVRPNTGYTLSARLRHDATPVGAGRFSVRINEYDSQGATIASRSVRGATGSGTSWTQSTAVPAVDATNYVAAGRTHHDCRYMRVDLYLQEQTGTFYADHVHLGQTTDGVLG